MRVDGGREDGRKERRRSCGRAARCGAELLERRNKRRWINFQFGESADDTRERSGNIATGFP